MKKVIIILSVAALCVLLLLNQGSVLGLLVTGHIPGTSLTIPFWGMMAFYCLLITLVVTLYVEEALSFRRDSKILHARKSRMPHRRYSHI
ncbi:MAG: hypothetical protein ABIP74_02010 [Candidatus Saccharimonas sp.]